jgi:hypothetical protein
LTLLLEDQPREVLTMMSRLGIVESQYRSDLVSGVLDALEQISSLVLTMRPVDCRERQGGETDVECPRGILDFVQVRDRVSVGPFERVEDGHGLRTG